MKRRVIRRKAHWLEETSPPMNMPGGGGGGNVYVAA